MFILFYSFIFFASEVAGGNAASIAVVISVVGAVLLSFLVNKMTKYNN
jgi:uncharacterized membrane protein YhhN